MTVVTANDAPTIRLGRTEETERNSKSLAILFAESIISNASSTLDDAADGASNIANDARNVARGTISQHNELIADVTRKYEGHIIRTMGAAVMAEFANVPTAVRAAVAMQRLSMESAEECPDVAQPALRIGMDGRTALDDQDMELFSRAVRSATNVAKLAAPGQILVSQRVSDALSAETDLHLQWFRTVTVEGQAQNEDVFEVHWAPAVANIPSRYEALFQVGAGGMGIVYKARDRETGDIVALKILRSEIAADPAMQENLRREVSLARKVTHKNVCRIHEFNRSNGTACISMEFVEGASLQSVLQRNGLLPWSEALKIALQICAGLGEAHAQGIVHRDLKPANIMMDRNGVAKIMDFGIARSFQGTAQMTGTLVGTPAYMAPEQVELRAVDARTDVYALGLLLYEIATGCQAFAGETPIAVAIKQLREFPRRPREIASTLPADAEAVIFKCLEKDAAKRFQTMDELAAALNRTVNRTTQTKTASAFWPTFVADFRGYGRELRSHVQPRVEALDQFVRRQDWKSLATSNKNTQRMATAGLGAVCLMGALAITVHSARKHRGVEAASLAMTAAATTRATNSHVEAAETTAVTTNSSVVTEASQLPTERVSLTAPTTTWSHPVDLGTHSDTDSRNQLVPDVRPAATSKAAKNIETVKTKPTVKMPAQTAIVAKVPVAAETAPANSSASASETISSESASSESAAAQPMVPTTAAPTATPTAEKPTDKDAAQSNHYLEVGSFKDSTWAEQAVAKLTQLGFHAASIRKNLLWVQSYQVRVGPYTDTKELENAKQALMSQGFKPHTVK